MPSPLNHHFVIVSVVIYNQKAFHEFTIKRESQVWDTVAAPPQHLMKNTTPTA